jgi:hypothetical protein
VDAFPHGKDKQTVMEGDGVEMDPVVDPSSSVSLSPADAAGGLHAGGALPVTGLRVLVGMIAVAFVFLAGGVAGRKPCRRGRIAPKRPIRIESSWCLQSSSVVIF